MNKKSAGILLFRFKNEVIEVLLAHPGGPFWKNKDKGAWSVPKGEFEFELPLEAAKREFKEEIGTDVDGDFVELMPIKQKNGKMIFIWALQGNLDTSKVKSNLFELEFPPNSGIIKSYPEIDKASWFKLSKAKEKINHGQAGFLFQLEKIFQL